MSKIHKTFDAFLFAAIGLRGPYPYQWELGTEEVPVLIKAASTSFASPVVTEVKYIKA